jgi:hypothetical protein
MILLNRVILDADVQRIYSMRPRAFMRCPPLKRYDYRSSVKNATLSAEAPAFPTGIPGLFITHYTNGVAILGGTGRFAGASGNLDSAA